MAVDEVARYYYNKYEFCYISSPHPPRCEYVYVFLSVKQYFAPDLYGFVELYIHIEFKCSGITDNKIEI
jgi:hypothetical protein